MADSVEVERAFTAPAHLTLATLAAALPGTGGVATVGAATSVQLDARYLDTADLRLAAYGITLRRRTGGGDAGWTLKLPSGTDARHEITAPLGRAVRPPAALTRLVRGLTGGDPVARVADLRTARTEVALHADDGQVLAVVTDDHVLATRPTRRTPTRWRELEVELVEGDWALLDALTRRLLALGARPSAAPNKLSVALGGSIDSPQLVRATTPLHRGSSAADVVMAYAGTQVLALVRSEPLVRLDVEDSVHRMRVAARRLRSHLASCRPVLDRRRTEPLREELRWLGLQLGRARDAEVMRERLLARLEDLPRGLVVGPVRAAVDTELTARYALAHAHAVRTLGTRRYAVLVRDLERLCADPPLRAAAARPARRILRTVLARNDRRVVAAVAAAEGLDGHERDLAWHEVRKAAKRARYAAEAAAAVLGADAVRHAQDMTSLQDQLGELQDCAVTRPLLLELAAAARARGEAELTYGVLLGIDQARADRLRSGVPLGPR